MPVIPYSGSVAEPAGGGGGGGSTTPGGSDTQVQFNNSSAFGGATHLTYASGTGVVTAAKGVVLKNGPDADPVIGVLLCPTNDERLGFRFGSNTAQGKAAILDGSSLNADRTRLLVNASIGESGQVVCRYANAATTGTTRQVLDSYVIPANTLGGKTNMLRMKAVIKTAANGNNKVFTVKFGSVDTFTATRALNNGTIRIFMDFVRTGASTQLWYGEYLSVAGGTSWDSEAATQNTTAQTDTSDITLSIDGTTATASGDMTLLFWTLEAMTAP